MFEKPSLDWLLHYGTKRHSGRYPWGSGEDPRAHSNKFLSEYEPLKAKGHSETEIAAKMGMNTTELRNNITWAKNEQRKFVSEQVSKLKEEGHNNTQISKRLGVSEATVRNYLKPVENVVKMKLENVTTAIKEGVDKTGYLDVGIGVERQLGVPRNKFNTVVNKLAKEEGYHIHQIQVKRLSDPTGSKYTTVKVLTKDPDPRNTTLNQDKIRPLDSWSEDGGLSLNKMYPPHMVDLNRIKIRYKEEGGEDRDGLIELRPGVKDLDLGRSKYAQVRIGAGENLYLKGMAAYSDESHFPKGVDIIFNTNKSKGTPVEKVLKETKKNLTGEQAKDPSAIFGSSVARQKGALNIVNEQGEWDTWSTKMSSQFLSKQPLNLIKDRLDDTQSSLQKEFDEINSMTNPIVKKYLLDSYIDGLDAKANHLKAKGLKNTKSHVLLPFPDMKPNEIYAPLYNNGDRVVLVRHPHGGIFEIPELIVNNKFEPAKKMLGTDAPDAVGIHPSVAQKLSGADFDGDTALVIPNNDRMVKTSRSLQELKNFDPHMYKVAPDSPVNIHAVDKNTGELVNTGKTISPDYKQTEMGLVSNLITDMTINDAPLSEIARAVKYSMVIIDAEKHNLDWKQAKIDNGIAALRRRYQTHINPDTGKKSIGASTLISRSKSKVDISDATRITKSIEDGLTKSNYIDISPGTEAHLNVPREMFNTTVKKMVKSGEYHVHDVTDSKGNKVSVLTKDPEASNVVKNLGKLGSIGSWTFNPDRYTSGTAREQLYSDYIKGVQRIKNDAMKSSLSIKPPAYSKEAAKIYAEERKSLDDKLNTALLNAPKERQAQILTNNLFYSNRRQDMTKDEVKKLKSRSAAQARVSVGAKKKQIEISEKEWEAIQAGAISNTKLMEILKNADMDIVRKLAAPRDLKLSTAKLTRAQMLIDKGYTYSEVANTMGVSVNTLKEELK